jgi:nucleotide-binding universal stress UspA family protein
MFHNIMVPVDLAHTEPLTRALEAAAMLARATGATVTYVGVTAETPTSVAHNPTEFGARLKTFADHEAEAHGIATASLAVPAHDPTIDLNDNLLKAADRIGADAIVMASHIPNLGDHLWPSHGGQIARRSKASVFVIR